jgi:hypothetical protein
VGGVYHEEEEVAYSWVSRESFIRSQQASSTASIAHGIHHSRTAPEGSTSQKMIAISPPKDE